MDLIARRAAIVERHRVLESVGGSGWHKKDPGSPYMLDVMPLSERPVGFVGDEDVQFVGEDIAAIQKALAAFQAKYAGKPVNEDDAQLVRSLKHVAKQVARRQHPDEYAISRMLWNDVNYALADVGVVCCITSLDEPCPTND